MLCSSRNLSNTNPLTEALKQKASYAPLTVSPGSIEAYGDSITAGLGLSAPTTQRYSTLIAAQYGLTEYNYGVSGDCVIDCFPRVYDNHDSSRSQFMVNIGFNDISVTSITEAGFSQVRSAYETMLLFLSLPAENIVNMRSGAVNRTGSWTNTTYATLGMYTGTNGATATATVSGRYVGFALTVSNAAATTITVAVDGVSIVASTLLPGCLFTTPNGRGNYAISFIYDTGSSGSHTIVVTNSAASNLDIDWFFGFDSSTFTKNVYAISPDQYDFTQVNAPYTGGTQTRQSTMRNIQRTACQTLRRYGAKTYYVEATTNHTFGNKVSDNIHPNVNGHKYIQDRFNTVLANGEFPYTS